MNRVLDRILGVAVHVFGILAFLYPFFLPAARAGEGTAHAADAPVVFAIFGALLIALAVSDVRASKLSAKQIALLGVLAGVNAVLRLPGALGGASLMFFLPIIAGYTFGARFGFLLGATSMAAGALITGGIGPWVPFQMWVLGWTGAGGGVVRALTKGRAPLAWLAVYGWAVGLLAGALLNLWFWPFLRGGSDLSWEPGLSAAATMVRYWRFYVVTSLAWDSARSIGNVVLILALGRSVLRLFERTRGRLFVTWAALPPEPASTMGA